MYFKLFFTSGRLSWSLDSTELLCYSDQQAWWCQQVVSIYLSVVVVSFLDLCCKVNLHTDFLLFCVWCVRPFLVLPFLTLSFNNLSLQFLMTKNSVSKKWKDLSIFTPVKMIAKTYSKQINKYSYSVMMNCG